MPAPVILRSFITSLLDRCGLLRCGLLIGSLHGGYHISYGGLLGIQRSLHGLLDARFALLLGAFGLGLLGLLLLFQLALLGAFGNGGAHGLYDHRDGFGCIVVCRDHVINVGRITTSVYHGKNGDAQSFGLLHGVGLLLYVHDEQSGRKARQVRNRTQVLFQLRTLAGDLEFLALREIIERAVVGHLVDGGHLLDGFTYGGEVGQHTACPTLRDVGHTDGCHLFGNNLLGLFFRGYEQHPATALGDLFQGRRSLIDFQHRLVQVDDVDAVLLHEDVRSHFRVPFALQVSEVRTGFQ